MDRTTLLWLCVQLFSVSFSTFTIEVSANAGATFCARAVASKSCATPPTVDAINLEAYLGHWYEIGSTASFKLLTEAGLVCDQAQYSSNSGNLSLVNSGLNVIGTLAAAQVSAVSLAARGVCTGAKDICNGLAPSAVIAQALQDISEAVANLASIDHADAALLSRASQKLSKSVDLAESAVQALADDVSQIQQSNGQISQANAIVPRNIAAIQRYANQASNQQAIVNALAGDLYSASFQVKAVSAKLRKSEANVKQTLDKAAGLLTEEATKFTASSTAIATSLEAIKATSATLLLDGKPIENGSVRSVNGRITQNSGAAAKLEVSINGAMAPYWIIDLEGDGKGGYAAALVYSCTEVAVVGVTKSLFILSREPQLDEQIVQKFLDRASSYGIYDDCDDPFLFTVQRNALC